MNFISKIKAVTCALVGHSKVQHSFFGYFNCARCDAQVGDSLGSFYNTEGVVIVDHNCKTCRDNYAKCTWKDKLFVANPFTKKEEESNESE